MQRLNIPSVCWASIIFCYNKLKNKNFSGNTARSAPPATIFAVVWAPHAHFHFICGLMLPGDRQLAAVQVTNWNNKNNNSGSNNNINNNNNNNNNSAQHFLALNTTQKSAKMNVYLYVQMKIFIYARGKTAKNSWKNWTENSQMKTGGASANSGLFEGHGCPCCPRWLGGERGHKKCWEINNIVYNNFSKISLCQMGIWEIIARGNLRNQ